MNPRIVPAFVAVAALVAASCGGSESTPDADTAGTSTTEAIEATEAAEDREADTDGPATPSTEAELRWVEVAVDRRVPAGDLFWTGTAFLVGSHDENGLHLLRSVNGVDWQDLSNLPGGVDWSGLHAAGESIVVWGTDLDRSDEAELDTGVSPEDVRMLSSTDGGASWVELDPLGDLGERFTSPYLRGTSRFFAAGVSGDIVFAVVETFVEELDLAQILSDNGVDPARLADGRRIDGGIAICLFPVGFDPADEDDEGFEEEGFEGVEDVEDDEGDDGQAVPAEEVVAGEEREQSVGGDETSGGDGICEGAEGIEEGIEQLDVTFEQLGLDDDDIAAIDMESGSFEIHRSLDGGPFERASIEAPAVGSPWYPGSLTVVDGEFVASATNESGETIIYRSADALEWEHGGPISGYIDNVTTDGASLFAQLVNERPAFVRSDDRGQTWSEYEVPGGENVEVFALFAGPSGMAAVGALIPAPSGEESQWFLIEKDGYGVTIDDDNSFVVVDLATGETLLSLPPDVDPAESEFVIMEEDSATIVDPDTLEPLVTITFQEWEQALTDAFGQRDEPEFSVGWAADGESWGWQTTAEAFGVNGWVQLAVGDGAVVAMIQSVEATDATVVQIFTAQLD